MSGPYQKLVYVPTEGPATATICLVGEAPGELEEAQRRPFVGRSGQLVRRILAEALLTPDDVKITNAVCVRPRGNRTPTPEELDSWLPHLLNAVSGCYKVIALGRIAASSLNKLGLDNFTSLYHPAFILRNPSARDRWESDFLTALRAP